MTYREICVRLRQADIESAEYEAGLLLEHFCGVRNAATEPDLDHPDAALAQAVNRRAARYPLQYILGEWSFYRQTYEVGPDCLIPRADTELLVEQAVRLLPRGAHFADLCTGSGCIAVSVLCERPDTRAVAVEKFEPTLTVAKRNAARNGVSDRFTPRLSDVLAEDALPDGSVFDAILSNPPYIRTEVLSTLAPELAAEPQVALDGGRDGLIFYRAILALCRRHLAPDGLALLEIGYDQADALTGLARAAGFRSCRILKDLSGNDRLAVVE